jgi:hypothetical protein
MTQDEIIEMAVKAGIAQVVAEANIDIMEAFAKLVATKEREECAKVCNELADASNLVYAGTVAMKCAESIRARGEA